MSKVARQLHPAVNNAIQISKPSRTLTARTRTRMRVVSKAAHQLLPALDNAIQISTAAAKLKLSQTPTARTTARTRAEATMTVMRVGRTVMLTPVMMTATVMFTITSTTTYTTMISVSSTTITTHHLNCCSTLVATQEPPVAALSPPALQVGYPATLPPPAPPSLQAQDYPEDYREDYRDWRQPRKEDRHFSENPRSVKSGRPGNRSRRTQ